MPDTSNNNLIHILSKHYFPETHILQHHLKKSKTLGNPLLHYLMMHKIINPEEFAKTCARFFKVEYHDLTFSQIIPLSTNLKFLEARICIPYCSLEHRFFIGISDPNHLGIIETLKLPELSFSIVFTSYIKLLYIINKVLSEYFYNAKNFRTLKEMDIIKITNHSLTEAIFREASDIHYEPFKTYYRIRMRIDGILIAIAILSLKLSKAICNRLKILANLDIATKHFPQDGRFSFLTENNISIDCRISSSPTVFGEKIVVRLLHSHKELLHFDQLGMEPSTEKNIKTMLKQPQGLILVTGPTGSGKTVTLYTMLSELNHSSKNIITIEDPIEIILPGVNQVNINSKIGLNFNTALRSLLRQDPDIILVGEIRDQETARMAVRAATTGHLVLSSLHTNSAEEAVTRLLSMGISSSLLLNALILVIAQRLIRRLCPVCKILDHENGKRFSCKEESRLFTANPKGCANCILGYSGRIGIYEILSYPQKRFSNRSKFKMQRPHTNNRSRILWKKGLEQVKRGLSSYEELKRVLPHEEHDDV